MKKKIKCPKCKYVWFTQWTDNKMDKLVDDVDKLFRRQFGKKKKWEWKKR